MDRELTLPAALEARLGARIERVQPLQGGSVSQASRMTLAGGRSLLVKTQAGAAHALFATEAEGLAWLDAARALRVPEVIAVGEAGRGEPPFLALEWIEETPRARDHDEQLGRGLARLHRAHPDRFGLARDNWLAGLPQDNRSTEDWPSFYATRRLEPMVAMVSDRGLLTALLRRSFARVLSRLPELCGAPEPPARLHGDLWSGNAITGPRGEPVLIDPAVYGGNRELDLAMMQLFGGFGPRCFSAYDEVYRRADGHSQRVVLYQLYPLLVHVRLFGASYLAQLERALAALE